jgi:Na+-transporting NADH:ubiquinone oxidoreductase subunit NqrF
LRLDDNLKALLRELGHAINDSVADSEKIAEAIANVRSAGYDIVLKLDATIGLAQRPAQESKMTTTDRRFLESLHIRVDEEVLDERTEEAKVDITPQDIKFLKSLKISLDENVEDV